MKLKISNGLNYDVAAKLKAEAEKCVACNGSGFYDSWNVRKNKPIKCASCKGTGKK